MAPLPDDVLMPLIPPTLPIVRAAATPGLLARLKLFVPDPLIMAASVPILLFRVRETVPDVLIPRFAAVRLVPLFSEIPPLPLIRFNIAAGDEIAAVTEMAPLPDWPIFRVPAVMD